MLNKFIKLFSNYLIFGVILTLLGQSASLFSQVDTEFWFAVPELSHRGSTGGTPGTLRISTLDLPATVTISMPANFYHPTLNPTGFRDSIVDIPANAAVGIDLSYLIDVAASPGITGLENKPLTIDGINNFGLHITSTNMVNAYWEVNYEYAADLWTLKGSNGLGTLFYTPFQTVYDNRLTIPQAYSAIDIVATADNTQVFITLPPGKAASYGSLPQNIAPGGTHVLTLDRGETFSIFPFLYSHLAADRLAGTRIESTNPIAVTVKDDALNTGSGGQDLIGDQLVPVDIIGDNYIVPDIWNPNHVYVVATENNTNIYVTDKDNLPIGPTPYTTLNSGEQAMIVVPNGSKYARITSSLNPGDPVKPFYVFQVAPIGNRNRAGALVPAIGCTGNTQLSFTRARENENAFNFFIITERGNEDKFLIDGVRDDGIIDPGAFTEIAGSGGWVALFTNLINASKLPEGQHLIQNTGGIFHLAIYNGFQSAQNGGLYYGYYSDFGGLNVGASVAGTNSEEIRACYGEPIQLYAFGGTTYQWDPPDYLDDATSNMPTAINLPPGPHLYTVEVSGACGSGTIPLTIIVSSPVDAHFETNVTSGCSPLEITFDDQSTGMFSWQYDLGDSTGLVRYDLDGVDIPYPEPPDPFTFTHTYTNTTDQPITYEVTLLVKNASGCADIHTKTITVFPEIHSGFTVSPDNGCEPLEVEFTNTSWGDTATWLWEFGDGGSSVEENPVHEYRNLFGPGNLVFDAMLIAISPFNCQDTSTLPITVSPFIEASFAYDTVAECSPHEIIITDQSLGADIYQWDFGDGNTSNSPGPVIAHTYVNSTPFPVTYTITLRVENLQGCSHQIQREVTVYPEVDAAFIPIPVDACSPAEIIFQNNSTGAVTYLWDFGDGGSSTEMHPIHYYDRNMLRHDTVFTVMLVATSAELCRDTAYFDVVIHPYIEAAFTIEDVVGCHPFVVTINNESVSADQYFWDFGDGTPTTGDPSPVLTHTYNNGTNNTVVYPLELIVTNTEGCRDTMVRNITVHPQITASFQPDTDVGCHPLTVNFADLSVNAVTYLWDFGDGAASVNPEPVHTFTNFGLTDTTYIVTLTTSTSDGECVESLSWPITVYPQVVSAFTFPNAQGCGPFEVTFENLSIGGFLYTWDFDDGTVISTLDGGPQTHIFNNTGFLANEEFNVSLLVENGYGCTSEAIKTVTVYPGIDSDFDVSDTAGCHPLPVSFTNFSTGGQTYIWDFGDGTSSNLQDPDHIFTNTGTIDSVYTVRLLAIAPNNICTDSFFMDIRVHPYIRANFTIPDDLGCNPFEVVIQNASINGDLFHWDFGDGTDTTTTTMDPLTHLYFNPDYTSQQDYEIILVAENYAGCTHEIRRTITVEPSIMAAFDASVLSGCHPLTVDFTNLSNGAAFYHWDFGNGTSSEEINPSQTFTNIGSADSTYRVWLYATAGNLVCRDSVFVDIVVYPYIMADFTFLEQVNCTPSVVQFNNASIGGASFQWDFGDGTDTITDNTDPITHTFINTDFNNNGVYQVTLYVENGPGCNDQITRTVEVYPAIEALFSLSVDEGCHPLEVDITNLSNGGYTYLWDLGDGATSSTDNPSHTFTNFTSAPVTRQVHLLATSQFNCTSEITAQVTIHPKPTARFETDRIIDCPPFDFLIFNTSLDADQYLWEIDSDTTIDTRAPDPIYHTFDNLTDDIATYIISLTASSDYGCVDSVEQKMYAYPRTIADFTVNDGDCSPFTAYFVNESVRGQTYLWDFGDGTTMSTTDPTNLYFNLSGHDTTYQVTLTSTSRYGCVDSASDIIEVYAQPDAEFIASPTYQMYPAAEVNFTNMSNLGDWSYLWTMGDGFTTTLEDPLPHTYAGWGDFEIWLRVSTARCADSVAHSIRIVPAAPIAAFDTVIPGCEPLTVQFRNNSVYGNTYLWEFDDGTTSTEFEPEHTFVENGIYNVKLTVTGDGGIEYAYRRVEVWRMPVVDFIVAPELVMLPDDEIRMFNLSKYGYTYLWDFGDGSTSTEESPRYQYTTIGEFDISLDVWTENGCTDRLVKPALVTVKAEGFIEFPNAFKPDLDGPNGGYYSLTEPDKNNIFHPNWKGVADYNLEIYTRWGEKLFYSNDVYMGWDGYNNGILSAQGVYGFRSWGFFINGEYFERKGNVTLLYDRK